MTQEVIATRHELDSVTDWKAGALAGVMAGVAFLMLEMVLVWIAEGQSLWGPPHMMTAMVLGKDVLPPLGAWASFDMKILMTAMMIYFSVSIVYGLIGALLMYRFDWEGALMIGAALGLAIYVVNFYIIAPVAFPWFEMARNWIGTFSHVMFGAILGVGYIALRRPRPTGR